MSSQGEMFRVCATVGKRGGLGIDRPVSQYRTEVSDMLRVFARDGLVCPALMRRSFKFMG